MDRAVTVFENEAARENRTDVRFEFLRKLINVMPM